MHKEGIDSHLTMEIAMSRRLFNCLMIGLLGVLFLAMSADTAVCRSGGDDKESKLGPWDWGHIRIVRSRDNFEFLKRLHATVNQGGGPIVFPKNRETGEYITDMAEFERMLEESRERVKKFHDEGMYIIAYTTMALGGSSATYEDTPKPEELSLNEAYKTPGLWEMYEEYFGPKPPEGPDKWVRHTHDMRYSSYRFTGNRV